MHYRKTWSDRIFDMTVYLLVFLLILFTLYPLIYTFSMAISDPVMVAKGKVLLFPKGIDFTAMKTVLEDENIYLYYYNTLWYTFVGTLLGVLTTSLGAYPLSRKEFRARGILMKFITFTMFFGGGLIPSYIVVSRFLHLYNSRWALILPGLTGAWYIIVARNFFQSLPDDIVESARIDGASEYRIFGQLILPLSKPILGVLTLYYAVGHWNSFFPAILYLSDKEKHPLATYVRSVVIQNSISTLGNHAVVNAANANFTAEQFLSSLQLKYAVVVVAVLPMLLIYPFLSKYLEKGLMIGSLKG